MREKLKGLQKQPLLLLRRCLPPPRLLVSRHINLVRPTVLPLHEKALPRHNMSAPYQWSTKENQAEHFWELW